MERFLRGTACFMVNLYIAAVKLKLKILFASLKGSIIMNKGNKPQTHNAKHGLFCLHKPTNLCLKHVCPWHLISHVAIDNWCVNLNYTLVARIFVRLSTHCQNTCKSQEGWGGIYDSKLAIGESVAHYASVWLLRDKLAQVIYLYIHCTLWNTPQRCWTTRWRQWMSLSWILLCI